MISRKYLYSFGFIIRWYLKLRFVSYFLGEKVCKSDHCEHVCCPPPYQLGSAQVKYLWCAQVSTLPDSLPWKMPKIEYLKGLQSFRYILMYLKYIDLWDKPYFLVFLLPSYVWITYIVEWLVWIKYLDYYPYHNLKLLSQ